jgi:hypothetical protein
LLIIVGLVLLIVLPAPWKSLGVGALVLRTISP